MNVILVMYKYNTYIYEYKKIMNLMNLKFEILKE